MGKKKKITTVEEELPETPTPGDGQPIFGELMGEDVPPDLYGVMEQLGETVSKVILHRTDKTGKSPYLTTMTADEFDQQTVAEQYGGGRYIAKLFGPHPDTGRNGVLKTYTFWIDDAVRPKSSEQLAARENGGKDARDALLERLLDKLTNGTPQRDPMEIAAALASASAEQMKNSVALIAPLLDKLVGGGKGGGMSTSDVLEAVRLGMDMGGDRESGGGYGEVIRDVGIPLVKAFEQQLSKPGGAVPKNPVPKQPVLPSGAPPWAGMLRPYILGILPYIQAGTSPEMVAATVDVQAPKLGEWFATAMTQPGFMEQLVATFPEQLANHRQWVKEFLDLYVEEEEEEEPAPGNTVTAESAEPTGGDEPIQ